MRHFWQHNAIFQRVGKGAQCAQGNAPHSPVAAADARPAPGKRPPTMFSARVARWLVHNTVWGSIATISNGHDSGTVGNPFVNPMSHSDGIANATDPKQQSSGTPCVPPCPAQPRPVRQGQRARPVTAVGAHRTRPAPCIIAPHPVAVRHCCEGVWITCAHRPSLSPLCLHLSLSLSLSRSAVRVHVRAPTAKGTF